MYHYVLLNLKKNKKNQHRHNNPFIPSCLNKELELYHWYKRKALNRVTEKKIKKIMPFPFGNWLYYQPHHTMVSDYLTEGWNIVSIDWLVYHCLQIILIIIQGWLHIESRTVPNLRSLLSLWRCGETHAASKKAMTCLPVHITLTIPSWVRPYQSWPLRGMLSNKGVFNYFTLAIGKRQEAVYIERERHQHDGAKTGCVSKAETTLGFNFEVKCDLNYQLLLTIASRMGIV